MNELSTKRQLTGLAELIAERFGSLEPDRQNLALAIYDALRRGPVAREDLATTTGISRAAVDEIIDEWPGVFENAAGEIVGFWGLAVQPMPHELQIGEETLYAWCAFDTLFIPELLGERASVRSPDPVSGRELRVEVSADRATALDADDVWVSLRPIEAFDEGAILSSFCHHIFFFESRATAERFAHRHEDAIFLRLDDAFELARLINRARFPDVLPRRARKWSPPAASVLAMLL